ncbi:SagB/ThcOx family dehydrogenase [Pseudomonas sp. NPDC089401]|uniref:SagB/ThcOx family dehydrogenase n=1 Tax=Pseudomonas sp. NPDC089401 TaxID=3364462 RepID=UPI003800980C
MNVSHDQYLRFVSNGLLDDVLSFHAKGNYVIHSTTQHFSTLHHVPASDLQKLSGVELSLDPLPPPEGRISPLLCASPLQPDHPLRRNDSCDHFQPRPMTFETVKEIIAPLLRKTSDSKRGYPSGGGIYPIEVFCVNVGDRIEGWPGETNALHLLAASKTFETHSPLIDARKLSCSITPLNTQIGSPTLALVYCMYLPKALFKYRYRGYRLALMEVGSMYMLTDLRCKELSLDSRPWAGFTDHQVTKSLNLNPALFLTICIQLIG